MTSDYPLGLPGSNFYQHNSSVLCVLAAVETPAHRAVLCTEKSISRCWACNHTTLPIQSAGAQYPKSITTQLVLINHTSCSLHHASQYYNEQLWLFSDSLLADIRLLSVCWYMYLQCTVHLILCSNRFLHATSGATTVVYSKLAFECKGIFAPQ